MIEAPSLRWGSATWMALMVPIRLVLMPSVQACIGGWPFMAATPACATTMSSLPNSARPASSAVRSWAASRTSALAVTIRWPVFSTKLGGLLEIFRGGQRVADGLDVFAEVDGDDVGALFGQPNRVAAALAACGAGDECDLAFNASHGRSFRTDSGAVGFAMVSGRSALPPGWRADASAAVSVSRISLPIMRTVLSARESRKVTALTVSEMRSSVDAVLRAG